MLKTVRTIAGSVQRSQLKHKRSGAKRKQKHVRKCPTSLPALAGMFLPHPVFRQAGNVTALLARCLAASARDIFGVGVPRARVRWVVFEERSQRRPGRGVARAPWRARDTGRLPKANEPACLQSIAGDRCSGPERRNTRAQPRRGAAGEAMGKRGLIVIL